MKTFFRTLTAAGMLITGMFLAVNASAGCVDLPAKSAPQSGFVQIAYKPGQFRLVNDDGRPTIVGLWKFTFSSLGNNVAPFFIPDGAPLDAGYAEWHSDGTEMMNSSRDPATSSFCMGAWKINKHPWSYQLNHFALSWDNTQQLCVPPQGKTSCFVGPTNIREQIDLDPDGDKYSGTVTIDQYDGQGNLMFHLQGTVKGERITANW
jgi:hypothetical protein